MEKIILTPFESPFSSEMLALLHSRYQHGGTLAVMACSRSDTYPDGEPVDGFLLEPYATVTVNLPHALFLQDETHAFVDTNNHEALCSWLVEQGIAAPTGISVRSGYCSYPLMEFDLCRMNAMDSVPGKHLPGGLILVD